MGLLPHLVDEDIQAQELPAEAANAIVARGIWLYRRVLTGVPLGDSQPGIAPLTAPERCCRRRFSVRSEPYWKFPDNRVYSLQNTLEKDTLISPAPSRPGRLKSA
jgi:hypothetical protein